MTTTFTPYTSLQQMFDIAATHLLKQGKKAVAHNGKSCMYRAPDGCKCAVGALIPDELYEPKMEGKCVDEVMHYLCNTWIISKLRHRVSTHNLLGKLQVTHDGYSPGQWPDRLRDIALELNLSTEVLG